MRNEDVRAVMKTAPIQLKMREQCLRWYGHVLRRPENHPVRWTDVIKRDLGEVGATADDALDRMRTTSGVRIIVSERFRDSIVGVERFDDRLIKIVVAAKERLHHFFSAHASQTGCSDQAKDEFWNLFNEKIAEIATGVLSQKIVPYETVAPQQRPLICTLKIAPSEAEAGRAMRCCKNQVVANE
ncbi:unnamed protein product [Heligmosomoides polygyrus]|uniref:Integrase n=1 Tax=Heligmosomoides polygyrus TaxID=6339 RepID=A0A183G564_HELPZ|nr:unnamed protein product [Heligmosomoides polygyrus]